MKSKIVPAVAAAALLGLGGAGVAAAAGGGDRTADGGSGDRPSRLDDGQDLTGRAKISERTAVAAARHRASGALDEVDLERSDGRLVFNVDVGKSDVKIDANTGKVVAIDADD